MNRYNTGLIHVARDICAHNRMLVMTISGSSDGQGGTEMSARRGEGPICGSNDHFCAFALSHQGQRTSLKEVGVGKLASSHMFEERKTEK
jgi:hypothetical protein